MLLAATLATQLVVIYQNRKLIVPSCKGQLINHDSGENQSGGNLSTTLCR